MDLSFYIYTKIVGGFFGFFCVFLFVENREPCASAYKLLNVSNGGTALNLSD